jgi:hypothetical protein
MSVGCSRNGWSGGKVSNDGYRRRGLDSNQEGDVGSEEEVVQLIMEIEGSVPDVII